MKISFAEFEPPRAADHGGAVGAVVVGVWEEGALTATAQVEFQITIPQVLYLRVGTGSSYTTGVLAANGTVDVISFAPTVGQLAAGGAVAGTGGDLTGGTETAAVIGNGGTVTLGASTGGAMNDGAGDTWTFTSSGPGSYTIGTVDHSAPQCAQPDDGTVTGANGHFAGSINLFDQDYSGSGCAPWPAPRTSKVPVTRTVAGSTRDTVPDCTLATHTEPSPAATPRGP